MSNVLDENTPDDVSQNNSVGKTKNEILNKIQILELELIEYFAVWKFKGGGTTGHAIVSAIKQTENLKNFFNDYC